MIAAVSWQLARRSLLLIPRIPSTFVPSLVMPVFITISFSGAFSAIAKLPGFPTDQILDWVGPMAILQGAAFAGITTGMGIARDVENGFYDRLLLAPTPRAALLLGPMGASAVRGLFPFGAVLLVTLVGGATLETPVAGIAILLLCSTLMAIAAGAWSLAVVYPIGGTNAAPIMQVGLFMAFFLSTAQVPLAVMTGWLETVARYNPMTNVLETARQGFLGDVTWAATWPGLATMAVLIAALTAWAARGLSRLTP